MRPYRLSAGVYPSRTGMGPGQIALAPAVQVCGDGVKRKCACLAITSVFSAEAREISRQARQAASEARAADLAPVIAELQAAGATSLGGLPGALTSAVFRQHGATRNGPRFRSPACWPSSAFEQ